MSNSLSFPEAPLCDEDDKRVQHVLLFIVSVLRFTHKLCGRNPAAEPCTGQALVNHWNAFLQQRFHSIYSPSPEPCESLVREFLNHRQAVPFHRTILLSVNHNRKLVGSGLCPRSGNGRKIDRSIQQRKLTHDKTTSPRATGVQQQPHFAATLK